MEMKVSEKIDSTHMPLELSIKMSDSQSVNQESEDSHHLKAPSVTLKWMEELSRQYLENLRSSDTRAKLQDAINMTDTEVDEAFAMLTKLLWENAKCMVS